MALSTIDPTPALIVVDLQQGIVRVPSVHPMTDIVERSASLATAFRAHGLPVVLVNADGRPPGRTEATGSSGLTPSPGWTELVDELQAQPSDLRITKQRWGAFQGTSLDADLRARGVTQVVVTGVATSAGVESTARFAHELGYHVVVAVDAITDRDPELHRNSVERIFPRIGETATTAEVLELLDATR